MICWYTSDDVILCYSFLPLVNEPVYFHNTACCTTCAQCAWNIYDSLLAGPTYSVLKNISLLSDSTLFNCSFLNNQSFYCMVCCSTDPSVPPDSSVYNISTTKGTEVTVSQQGLISGQMYFCKVAATNSNSTCCAGPVVGDVKMYFSFVASLPSSLSPIHVGFHAFASIEVKEKFQLTRFY